MKLRFCARVLPALAVLCLVATAGGPAYALPRDAPRERFVVQVWGPRDGAPQGQIWSIEQTPDGFLWLGTGVGVSRFDGVSFRLFQPTRSTAKFTEIGQDANGRLWIAGAPPETLTGGRFTDRPTPGFPVNSLHRDTTDRLWFVGPGGLARLAEGGLHDVIRYDTRITVDERVRLPLAVAPRPDGLLVASERGLWRYVSGSWSQVAGITEPLFSVVVGRDGGIWVGGKAGVLRIDPHTGGVQRFGEAQGLPGEDRVYVLHEDRDGTLWAGTRRGLARWSGVRFEPFWLAPDGLGDRVWGMGEDRDGNLWVGSTGHLARIRLAPLQTIRLPDVASSGGIPTALAPGDGGIWAGDLGGTLWFVRTDGAILRVDPSDANQDRAGIVALMRDSANRLWIGRASGAGSPVCYREEQRLTCLGSADGLVDEKAVRALYEDSSGNVWIAAQGLYRWSAGKLTVEIPATTTSTQGPLVIRSLIEDEQGRLWAATRQRLWYRDRDGWHQETAGPNGRDLEPHCLLVTRDGGLWIGTNTGIGHLQDGKLHTFRTGDGVMDAAVFGMVEHDGILWLATASGLVRVRLSTLQAFEEGRQSVIPVSHYGPLEGLGSQELVGPYNHLAIADSAQRLWVATFGGVNLLDMQTGVGRSAVSPTASIEQVWVEEQEVQQEVEPEAKEAAQPKAASSARAEATRQRGSFAAVFTAPALTAPGHLRFRYRLHAYDRDWVLAGPRRRANYTNLPAGDYRFEVSAQYDDSPWSDNAGAFVFRLRPPFRETGLFKGLLVGLALALVVIGYRWRLGRLRERHDLVIQERTRIARELHDTVAQGFSAIALQLDTATRLPPERTAEHVTRAREIARASAAEARTAIWALRHEALARGDLHGALDHVAREFANTLPVEVVVTGGKRMISEANEQALLRVAQEALTNVTRHAEARSARIDLVYEEDAVTMRVTDDGKGFDSTRPVAHRYGVLGMRERLQATGGTLSVESTPGTGTRVIARIPHTPRSSPRTP